MRKRLTDYEIWVQNVKLYLESVMDNDSEPERIAAMKICDDLLSWCHQTNIAGIHDELMSLIGLYRYGLTVQGDDILSLWGRDHRIILLGWRMTP